MLAINTKNGPNEEKTTRNREVLPVTIWTLALLSLIWSA